MKDDAYAAVEEEAERLRVAFSKRYPETNKECPRLRANLGRLKTGARRAALKLIKQMQQLDENLIATKAQIVVLQKAIDIDLRREGVIRNEEHQRKERIRQERLDNLNKVIDEHRRRRKRKENDV